MQTLSRLYANEENARKARDELQRRGFADCHLFTASQLSEGAGTSAHADRLLEEMAKVYIVRSEAAIYARRVSEGASLVSVHAPFSGGKRAETILDANRPIESGVTAATFPTYLWDDSAPLSSALRWPLLSKTEFPFETVSGIPSLIETKHGTGAPVQPDDPAPFSAMMGMPVLLNNPSPLSSLFSFPVLIKSGPMFY
jgi:hypothetical protein